MPSLNDKFEIARKNVEYIKVAKSVTKKFPNLSKDEKVQCFYIGLYKALGFYKKFTAKFTSYLWKMIYWECLKFISDNCQSSELEQLFDTSYEFNYVEKCFPQLIKGLPRQLKTILHDRYVKEMTLNEIGDKHKFSYETARCRINKALKLLKLKLKNNTC